MRSFLVSILATFVFSFLSAQYTFLPDFQIQNHNFLQATAGGLNNPQYTAADLNNDGLQDLVVFDRAGDMFIPFIRQADSSLVVDFSYQKHLPNCRNWAIGTDYNDDGAQDFFTFSVVPGIAGISAFRGYYDADTLKFEQVVDYVTFPLANGIQTNLFVTNIDIPAVADIDFDGDMDIASFNVNGGRIEYFQNQSVEMGYGKDSLIFLRESTCFGGLYESGVSNEVSLATAPGGCANNLTEPTVFPRHAGSTLLLHDFDEDEDMDLFLGDVSFSAINFLINGGSKTENWFSEQDPNFPSNGVPVDIPIFPAAFAIDTDLDGTKEILVAPNSSSGSENRAVTWRYEQMNNTDFELQEKSFLVSDMVDLGAGTAPTFTDIDNDGDHDLLVGIEGQYQRGSSSLNARLFLFENQTNDSQPLYVLTDSNFLRLDTLGNEHYALAPAFGDLDGDGNQDLLIGTANGNILHYEKQSDNFQLITETFASINIGTYATPCIANINDDMIADLLVGERNGNVNYFEGSVSGFSANPTDDFWSNIDTRASNEIAGFSQPMVISSREKEHLWVASSSGRILDYGTLDAIQEPVLVQDINYGKRTKIGYYRNQDTLKVMVGNIRGGFNAFQITDFFGLDTSDENVEVSSWRMYPNPAQGIVQIESDQHFERMEVYDATGRLLLEHSFQHTFLLNQHGVFLVKLIDKSGAFSIQKLINMPN